ncbi:MAG TPA: Lrp/AsnC ligand binding domain-containing protein [Victivallales bacterium]|nr:Lrp/AsnC ligand binding domain-containing protein [Victivallales bacterium]HPO89728.1 Lrp/AsnC ligand binding domain-containing protein [Victivallales bacterium]HRR06944.1 Lrp/AsnC ligand binding domain-containing protein [Victivallales bacterium]HRR29322.1 Lrp/AsnC ligand binding domain-containing protein [Victivallales bacterium]HRU00106.1 Lrp/AsnC ligand binding domain-containing protein [Victivallales bacterium]
MVTAIVLINIERPKLRDVTNAILSIDGVTELYTIAGEYDLAAIIRVKDNHQLSEIVVNKMPHDIPGIIHTKTLVALQAHSKFNLEELFSIKS